MCNCSCVFAKRKWWWYPFWYLRDKHQKIWREAALLYTTYLILLLLMVLTERGGGEKNYSRAAKIKNLRHKARIPIWRLLKWQPLGRFNAPSNKSSAKAPDKIDRLLYTRGPNSNVVNIPLIFFLLLSPRAQECFLLLLYSLSAPHRAL